MTDPHHGPPLNPSPGNGNNSATSSNGTEQSGELSGFPGVGTRYKSPVIDSIDCSDGSKVEIADVDEISTGTGISQGQTVPVLPSNGGASCVL